MAPLVSSDSPFIAAHSRGTHVHHKLQANAYSEMVSLDFDYVQKTNDVGFRGRNIGTDQSPALFRIFMQGDSFTMGKGVKDDETFSYLLEKSLRAKGIKFQGKGVEIVNGGVDSYAPILEFFQLNGRIDQLKPDLVILNFDMSDLLQEAAYRSSAAVRDAAGQITGIDGTPEFHATLMPDTTWVDHHLYLGRYFLYYLNSLSPEKKVTIQNTVLTGDMELLKHTLMQDDQDRTAQWANIFDSIHEIKKLCETHNSDFLLTTYPWGHQVNDIEWTPGRSSMLPKDARPSDRSVNTLADFAQRSGIDFLNAFPLFRAYKNSATEPLYFKYDMHWRPVGHRMFRKSLSAISPKNTGCA